jgi:polysaccharide deacetylase 2 family uncharacterized protein YibQ
VNQGTTQDTTDDLSTPLGQQVKRRPAWLRYRLPFTLPQAATIILGLVLLTFAGYAVFNDDPLGGEPMAKVVLAPEAKMPAGKEPAKMAPSTPPVAAKLSGTIEQKTITIIDGSSGARRDVTVPSGDADAPAAPGTAAPAPTSPAPAVMANINSQLLENTRYGMVPVITSGLKPSQVYAAGNDALRARAATMPAIAIVVSGLGIGAAKTTDAIMKLPPAVTLAFTPYGADPTRLVERARSLGHEILLQIPLEPFDYPDNDPGPQTLLTTLSAEQNQDRLLWLLSRFQGYVGLSNFMGARFLPNEASMLPLMREAAKRGLAYFDDGAAVRSLAGQMALAQAVPFAKADSTIDVVPNAGEIDRALAQLEATARQRGFAVGVASALPLSIERLNAWARAAETRGILLVPLTTVMTKSKSS